MRSLFIGRLYKSLFRTCGLGLGATPTAMANMQALCKQYVPSVKAFLIVPVVGGIILDFMNSILITFFINVIG